MRHGRLFRTTTTALLTLVVLTTSGIFTQMPLRAPVAHAAPAAMPPRGPAPYGALPLQANQPAPALPVTSWQAPTPKTAPATTDTAPVAKSAAGPAAGRSPGEQVDLRTANSKTYLNADGTWTLRASDGPMHYQDAQGHWQDIDTTVVGDASDAGYPLRRDGEQLEGAFRA